MATMSLSDTMRGLFNRTSVSGSPRITTPIDEKVGIFGLPIEDFEEFGMVPMVVLDCIQYLTKTTERLSTEGLFRVSPNYRDLSEIKKLYQTPLDRPDLENVEIHVVCGLLKNFLASFPEPLFPFEVYQPLVDVFSCSQDQTILTSIFQKVMRQVSSERRCILLVLFEYFNLVLKYQDQNKMTAANLAIVFAPGLLRPKQEDKTTLLATIPNEIVCFLIENYEVVLTSRDRNAITTNKSNSNNNENSSENSATNNNTKKDGSTEEPKKQPTTGATNTTSITTNTNNNNSTRTTEPARLSTSNFRRAPVEPVASKRGSVGQPPLHQPPLTNQQKISRHMSVNFSSLRKGIFGGGGGGGMGGGGMGGGGRGGTGFGGGGRGLGGGGRDEKRRGVRMSGAEGERGLAFSTLSRRESTRGSTCDSSNSFASACGSTSSPNVAGDPSSTPSPSPSSTVGTSSLPGASSSPASLSTFVSEKETKELKEEIPQQIQQEGEQQDQQQEEPKKEQQPKDNSRHASHSRFLKKLHNYEKINLIRQNIEKPPSSSPRPLPSSSSSFLSQQQKQKQQQPTLLEELTRIGIETPEEVSDKLLKEGVTLNHLQRGIIFLCDFEDMGVGKGVGGKILKLISEEERVPYRSYKNLRDENKKVTKEYDDLEELIFREILEIMEKEKGEKEIPESVVERGLALPLDEVFFFFFFLSQWQTYIESTVLGQKG